LSSQTISLVNELQQKTNAITFIFGNAYSVKNFCNARNLVLCYEDNAVIQNTAADLLKGIIPYKGELPVTVCENFKFGYGLTAKHSCIPYNNPNQAKINPQMVCRIDSIAADAIARKAMPGCVVLVAKDGGIVFEKAYGNYTYNSADAVSIESVYDVASVTKICATTISVMKLYDEGKIDLSRKLVDYLPSVKGTNKEFLTIEKLLLHQAGLVPFIPFYKETLDSAGNPLNTLYREERNDSFSIRVAEKLFIRNDWKDSIYKSILESPVNNGGKYVYSDNDFIFLGMVIEKITGMPLDEYVKRNFTNRFLLHQPGFYQKKISLKKESFQQKMKLFFAASFYRGTFMILALHCLVALPATQGFSAMYMILL
jgi:beta-N-acetylhexosaminidase